MFLGFSVVALLKSLFRWYDSQQALGNKVTMTNDGDGGEWQYNTFDERHGKGESVRRPEPLGCLPPRRWERVHGAVYIRGEAFIARLEGVVRSE